MACTSFPCLQSKNRYPPKHLANSRLSPKQSFSFLIQFPCRLRTRTTRHAPLVPPPQLQPLLRTQIQLPLQLRARFLAMDEVAEAAPDASFPAVEPAACFPEIRHGGELAVDRAGGVPAAVQGVASLLGRVFVFETRVDVADEIWGYYKTSMNRSSPMINGWSCEHCFVGSQGRRGEKGGMNLRSLLLSQTTTSSGSPYLHISHQKSS